MRLSGWLLFFLFPHPSRYPRPHMCIRNAYVPVAVNVPAVTSRYHGTQDFQGHTKQAPPKTYTCQNAEWRLHFVDPASLYNLVNKTNLVHNLFLVYLYLSISTCFGRLWANHQEIQLCLYATWYLLFCVDDCLVCLQAGSEQWGRYTPARTW
jgi:hypothetical protein